MKLPFGNKKQQQTNEQVPTEIKQYYTSEQRDRAGATWLLGVGVFIITVLLVLGVFYGGRALYRTFFTDDQATEQTTSSDTTQQDQQGSAPDNAPSTTDGSAGNDTPAGGSDTEVTPPTPAPAPAPETPQAGPSQPEEIPQTGPDRFF